MNKIFYKFLLGAADMFFFFKLAANLKLEYAIWKEWAYQSAR